MKAIDTNVLIRLLLKDDPKQSQLAYHFIQQNQPVFVSHIVLCEVSWVFASVYKIKKIQLIEIIKRILLSETFLVEESGVVWDALTSYEKGSADFSDALIGQVHRAQSCETTVTFDKQAANLKEFTLIA